HSGHFAASSHVGSHFAARGHGPVRSIGSQGYRASRLGKSRPDHRIAARSHMHPRSSGAVAHPSAPTPGRHRVADGSAVTTRSRGGFVGWRGRTFWPEAYRDIHGWTLWPQAFGRGFWSFAYDDVFAGTLWPPGSPMSGTVGRLSTAGDRPDRPDSSTLSPDFS